MLEFNEVKISRILNPTAIDLGDFVINPYKGCAYACLYCYVRFNKVVQKEKRLWGGYVNIRINAPQLLERELSLKKPKAVLLGSTTECFQPIERKYGITRDVLRVLNAQRVGYSILTRSPFILEYIPLLKQGFCKAIYFTINNMGDNLKMKLEPKSPSFQERIEAINKMLEEGLPVIPYFSPLLPWVSDFKEIFGVFGKADRIEFEGLNFRLGNIQDVIEALASVYPDLKDRYLCLKEDKAFYESTWTQIKREIIKLAIEAKKNYYLYIHNFGSYFENNYG